MVEMEKSLLKKLCRDHDLYVTPYINDKLYLHYKGFRTIQNLDEYTGLKVLWLEGNGFPRIEGLEHQTELRTLYLQENLIQTIENLEAQRQLDTLNLAQNQITRVENLAHMTELTSLTLKGNYLSSASDLEHVLKLPRLAVLDVQGNRLTDPDVLTVLSKMPSLKVLYLQGNDVVKHIKQYRKTLIYRCRQLKYLDDRPVFEDERRRVDAWGRALDATNGDYRAAQEAERVEMERIRQEKTDRDRLNFLHFEQLMADGRRKKKEAEAEAAAAANKDRDNNQNEPNEQEEQQPEVNVFSGERIVPVTDCAFLQQQRQQRWEKVVNEPEVWTNCLDRAATATTPVHHQRETTTTTSAAVATHGEGHDHTSEGRNQEIHGGPRDSTIPVDAARLALLHECASVGSGNVTMTRGFVEEAFQVHHQSEPVSEGAASVESSRLPPATRVVGGLTPMLLHEPHCRVGNASEPQLQQPVPMMPPPAPVRTMHTNVRELD